MLRSFNGVKDRFSFFQRNSWFWKNWISTGKRMKVEPYVTPCTQMKSKWIRDLNGRRKKGKHQAKSLDMTPKNTANKRKNILNIYKMKFMEIKNFCAPKETIKRVKRQYKIIYVYNIYIIPWRRAWQPSPIFFPGESHGQRSLAGYGP